MRCHKTWIQQTGYNGETYTYYYNAVIGRLARLIPTTACCYPENPAEVKESFLCEGQCYALPIILILRDNRRNVNLVYIANAILVRMHQLDQGFGGYTFFIDGISVKNFAVRGKVKLLIIS